MSGPFVPLQPATATSAAGKHTFRAHVVPAAKAGHFHSVAQFLPPPDDAAASRAPKVECDHDGRRVTRIRVTCFCGQVIELDCQYE